MWERVDDGAGFPALTRYQVQETTGGGHSHDFYEIVYVLDGFCLHVCNGISSLLMSGDIVALRPGDVHRYRGQRNVNIINFLFLPASLDGVMDEVLALPGMADFFGDAQLADWHLHRHLTLKDRERVQSFLRELSGERTEKQVGWMLRSKALMMDFMVFFSRIFSAHFPARQGEATYMGYVSAALGQIEARYHESLTVADIARHLGISPDHLTRQFRQAMGITPIEHLRRYRFARALELLRQQQPVGEVCQAVGFHHLSHFSREFKTLFDMTPSAFQRQSREWRNHTFLTS